MESQVKINLSYNKKNIEFVLPSTYEEFLKLLEDTLYLTPELVRNAKISYFDADGDSNDLSEDNYENSLTDSNGNWEMELDFGEKTNNDESNDNADEIKKNDNIDKINKKDISKTRNHEYEPQMELSSH